MPGRDTHLVERRGKAETQHFDDETKSSGVRADPFLESLQIGWQDGGAGIYKLHAVKGTLPMTHTVLVTLTTHTDVSTVLS
jgi:hypothetical protein